MQQIDLPDIVAALKALGLGRGDVVNVYSRLFTIGMIRGRPAADFPEVLLEAFWEVIGPEGTVVAPTYTTSFGRFGKPFILEKSPSEFGIFSEHVRTQPLAVRSLHPIQSCAAIGGKAQAMTADHPRWNVGHDTVWDRMLKASGKVVTLGLAPWKSLSLMHHAELLACVPYIYHKLLTGEVYAGGVRMPGPFVMAVRYLEFGAVYSQSRLQQDLLASGALKSAALGSSRAWMIPMQDALAIALRRMRQDPYYLLQSPPAFEPGRIPQDGITSPRESGASMSGRYFR